MKLHNVILWLLSVASLGFLTIVQVRAQFIQQGSKLVATDGVSTAVGANQGWSVALSTDGNTAIVGGWRDSLTTGAAWVFIRTNGVWSQQGSKLAGTGAVGSARQGYSVALSADGNTAIVGGYADSSYAGAAWVFTRTNGVWSQQGSKLKGTGFVGKAQQGVSVALSADGNTAIVGGFADNSYAGAAWMWTRVNGIWIQWGTKLVGSGAAGNAEQGVNVALSADGQTALVGGPADNGAGAAWVFALTGGVWTQQGSKLVGTGAVGVPEVGFSLSLSADGNTAIVGGENDNSGAGAAWIFTRTGGGWSQQGNKLFGTGAIGNASQGWSVGLSADGNTAIVGGEGDNSGTGAAWVFTRTNGAWSQWGPKLVGSGAVGYANQGLSVALSADGNTAIVGGEADSSLTGAAWVFERTSQTFISISDVPNDQGGSVRLNWRKSPADTSTFGNMQITSYGIWRKIPTGMSKTFAPKGLANVLNDTLGAAYDFIATVPAVQSPTYNVVAPTLADSSPSGRHWSVFLVSAHTANPNIYFLSPPDSGYSVDNVAPLAPANPQVIPLVNGPIQLTWNRDRSDPDVGSYAVYRSTQDGFTIGVATRLSVVTDTTTVDNTTTIGQTYYYRLTTVDIHGNESVPTAQLNAFPLPIQMSSFKATVLSQNGLRLDWVTLSETNNYGFEVQRSEGTQESYQKLSNGFVPGHGTTTQEHLYSYIDATVTSGQWSYRLKQIDLTGIAHFTDVLRVDVNTAASPESVPTEFSLGQNYPNPFNPSTTITLALPRDARVSLEVYNTLGQKVAQLVDATLSAGYHSVTFDASQLASGVYLYRMTAGDYVATKKLLLMK